MAVPATLWTSLGFPSWHHKMVWTWGSSGYFEMLQILLSLLVYHECLVLLVVQLILLIQNIWLLWLYSGNFGNLELIASMIVMLIYVNFAKNIQYGLSWFMNLLNLKWMRPNARLDYKLQTLEDKDTKQVCMLAFYIISQDMHVSW